MIVDFDTCEWDRPGGNPSMVTIEQAAARGVPEVDRAELVRQFNERAYFDMVKVKRASIVSVNGAAQYAALVSNMNFSAGGLCHTVTRNTWSDADEQWALVFKVSGRYYGYAAICRNLFSLYGVTPPPEKKTPPTSTSLTTEPIVPAAPPVATTKPADTFCACEGGDTYYYAFFGGGSTFFGGPVIFPGTPPQIQPPPEGPNPSPVPEPEIVVVLLAGLAAIAAMVQRRRA